MNKFIAGLTPVQKILFYITVLFVAGALFDRLLIGPTQSKLVAINESIENEENSIKRDLRFLSYKDRINKESKIFEAYYTKTEPREEEVMSSFLDKLDKLVSQSGLTLLKNNRSNEQKDATAESKDYYVYRADLEASGSLDNMAKLMYGISTSPDFMKIVKLNLAMKKTGEVEEMKASMVVAKYIITAPTAPVPAPDAAAAKSEKPAK